MLDTVSIPRVNLLHPKWRADVISFVDDCEKLISKKIRITQGLRTFDEQSEIWALGRTKVGKIVTNAKAGQTYHNYGLAVDIVPINNDGTIDWHFDYLQLSHIAAKYNIQMGINFPTPDYDHFENKYGYNWKMLLEKYNAKDFIAGTNYVNI